MPRLTKTLLTLAVNWQYPDEAEMARGRAVHDDGPDDRGCRRLDGRSTAAVAVVLVGLYGIAVLTVPGQWLDDEIFGWAQRPPYGPLRDGLPVAARRVLPFVMLLALVLVAGWRLARGRWAVVAAALLVPLISIPLARWLRVTLPRPDHGYSYVDNTLPSTHAAVVVAAAVAIAMMFPSERPASLGWCLGGVAAVACLGNVVGHAHRPSDVLASVLLVIAVAGVVRGLSRRLARRDRGDRGW